MDQPIRQPAPYLPSQDAEEARRRADIAKVPVAMALLDLELRPITVSAGWLRDGVSPVDPAQPLSVHFVGEALIQARREALGGKTATLQVEAALEAGAPRRWWSMTLGPWPADGSPAQQLVLNAREVTDVVVAAFAAQQAQQRLAMALKLDRSVVRETNLRTGEVALSSMCPDLEAHFQNHRLEDCACPRDRPLLALALDGCARHGRAFKLEFRLARADGEETWICAIGERFSDIGGGQERTIVVLKDVTEHQRHQRRIEALAFKDPLTGLANRAAFQAAFDEAVMAAKDESFGLVMIDLDFFKQVNDAMGHDAGDAVLKGLAGQLRRAFRQSDVVARLGGDEFAVLLRGIDDEDALVRPIEALLELLRTPVQHGGESIIVGASIGAALHRIQDDDPRQIFKNTDVALYQAKLGGRGRSVVFEPAMRSETDDRRQLLRDIREGLTGGQFSLAYQPILDLQTGRIDGLEALLRWERPGHGLLKPGQFLAALEDHELGLKLGELTLDMALAQMRQWTDQGLETPTVSINVSAGQLRNLRLAEDIAGKLSQWNLPASMLALEISESVYGGVDVAVTIAKLDALGVRVTLDDFGAAYASLGNLRRFPINRVKIGKAFIASLDEEIIGSILRLGAALGVQVVADGVEAESQLAAIRRQGCEHAQGYYLARPMSAQSTGDYLANFVQAAVA